MKNQLASDIAETKDEIQVSTTTDKELTYLFSVSKNQLKRLDEFHEKHCHCGNNTAIGGAITYEFTPTFLGIGIVIRCHCGVKLDVTEYENW